MRHAFLLSALSLFALQGCTTTEPPQLEATGRIVTGSVAAASAGHGVDPKDAELIKREVASSRLALSEPLEWRNEATGAFGAIMAIEPFRGRHGQPCRSFRTTMANFTGVSLYEGEACQVPPEPRTPDDAAEEAGARSWILSWFRRKD